MDKKYQALYNAPFGESGKYGEQGSYLGLEWHALKYWTLNAYVDAYKFSWASYDSDLPSQGFDLLLQLEGRINRKLNVYVRYKHETEEENNPIAETFVSSLSTRKTERLRIHANTSINSNWSFSNRVEWSFINQIDTSYTGNLAYSDIKYTNAQKGLKIILRYALIHTPDYNARIYAYENDLLYNFSIPAYYGKANRFYIIIKYKVSRLLKLEMKYSKTTFFDRDYISNGLNQIEGNSLSTLKLQLRYRF